MLCFLVFRGNDSFWRGDRWNEQIVLCVAAGAGFTGAIKVDFFC